MARDDERRFALRVLDSVLGGTSSSRLFQAVREQRGLAYSVFTFQSLYRDTGQIGLYVGTRPENLVEVCEVLAAELARIREEPVAAEELIRAKDNVKGRIVLALESTSARMERLGSAVLAEMPILELDETLERIDAVDADAVGALAGELLASDRLSAAAIGPDEEVFRTALAPLLPALAEAR
jgi:predicted Zn-dependent peptidase